MGPSSMILSNARHAVVPNVAIKQNGIRPFSWSSLIAVLSVSPRKLSMKSTDHVWYHINIDRMLMRIGPLQNNQEYFAYL